MMLKKITLLLGCCLYSLLTIAQDHFPGELLVQLTPGRRIDHVLSDINKNERAATTLRIKEAITAQYGIYLLGFDPTQSDEMLLLEQVRKHPDVRAVQFNHPVQQRSTNPNDALYNKQWSLRKIQAPQAWDFTTGGLTAKGDTIVIATVDFGAADLNHEDLKGNLWRNYHEIPDDGIDNDQNGYIDDYLGWRVDSLNDNITKSNHATFVAGIIGAHSNNDIGMAGINWHIKMMFLTGATGSNSDAKVMAAAYYVLNMRERYNNSHGADGAFVTALNMSIGVDKQTPDNFPLWCNAIEDLGQVGVLSISATANHSWDVDQVGDIPTNCTSDYQIAVTSTDSTDKLAYYAAFGAQSIDLGAPGSLIESIEMNNSYAYDNGTSYAAPHVSGAVGLIYSLPSLDLAEKAISEPAATALKVKQMILDGTDPLSTLQGATKSGGRLNLYRSLELFKQVFGFSGAQLGIDKVYPNPSNQLLHVQYSSPDLSPLSIRVFNALGQLIYQNNQNSLVLANSLDIDVSNWAYGVYFLSISQDKSVKTQRILVVK